MYVVFELCGIDTSSYEGEAVEKIASRLISYIFAPAFSFFLDSALYGLFRGTFGKWLFGVKVIEESGEKPKASRYFVRNLGVLFDGCGLCIPIVTLITRLKQYGLVSEGEPTTYDKRLGFKSIECNCSPFKSATGIVLITLFFLAEWISRVLIQ